MTNCKENTQKCKDCGAEHILHKMVEDYQGTYYCLNCWEKILMNALLNEKQKNKN